MRLIEKPFTPVQCPNCNATLGVTIDDIEMDEVGQGPQFHVSCVSCDKTISMVGKMNSYMIGAIAKKYREH